MEYKSGKLSSAHQELHHLMNEETCKQIEQIPKPMRHGLNLLGTCGVMTQKPNGEVTDMGAVPNVITKTGKSLVLTHAFSFINQGSGYHPGNTRNTPRECPTLPYFILSTGTTEPSDEDHDMDNKANKAYVVCGLDRTHGAEFGRFDNAPAGLGDAAGGYYNSVTYAGFVPVTTGGIGSVVEGTSYREYGLMFHESDQPKLPGDGLNVEGLQTWPIPVVGSSIDKRLTEWPSGFMIEGVPAANRVYYTGLFSRAVWAAPGKSKPAGESMTINWKLSIT